MAEEPPREPGRWKGAPPARRLRAIFWVAAAAAPPAALAQGGIARDPLGAPISRRAGGGCLEAEASKARNLPPDDGSNAFVWACEAGSRWQNWFYDNVTKQLHNDVGGLCLDAKEPNVDGGRVHMWTCYSQLPSQKWDYDPATGLVRSQASSQPRCLSTGQQAWAQLWPCNPLLLQQQWTLEGVPAAIGLIRHTLGLCLNAEVNAVALRNCSGVSRGQQWTFATSGNEIKTQDGLCLSSSGLALENCKDQTRSQQWRRYLSSGAIMSFRGGCMTAPVVQDGATGKQYLAEGSQVQVSLCTYDVSQQWITAPW